MLFPCKGGIKYLLCYTLFTYTQSPNVYTQKIEHTYIRTQYTQGVKKTKSVKKMEESQSLRITNTVITKHFPPVAPLRPLSPLDPCTVKHSMTLPPTVTDGLHEFV